MEKPMDIYLHVISPIHIGCDDVYEPTAFVVDELRKKLISFDPMDFIKSLSLEDRDRFTNLCMEGTVGSLIGIYKFMAGRKINGAEVDVASDFISHYRDVKALPMKDEKKINQELNRFIIARTIFNPQTNAPYIPGSSLKGALRTAYLSKLAKDQGIRYFWEKQMKDSATLREEKIYEIIGRKRMAHVLEESLLKLLKGTFETDPFRMVKISDFLPFSNVKTKIVYAVNRKKKVSKHEARGPFQILEILQNGTTFRGTLAVQRPHEKAGIREPITFEKLWKALRDFYQPAFEGESKLLEEIGVDGGSVTDAIRRVFPNGFGEKALLVRLGRHSGAEAVTIEGNRYIRIMQAKGKPPKFESSATTLWLAAESRKPTSNRALLPFGWAILSSEPIILPDNVHEKKEAPEMRTTQPETKAQTMQSTTLDRFISEIRKIDPMDAGRIGTTIDRALKELISEEDRKKFAVAVRDHMGAAFKKSKAKQKLQNILGE